MSNKPRVVTVVLVVRDQETANLLWEAHKNNTHVLGCSVAVITEENVIKKLRQHEEFLEDAEGFYDLQESFDNFVEEYG